MGNGTSSKNHAGLLLETKEDHDESINCMALSEDGSMLVTGSEDSTARMWSTKTEETECIGVLKGHSSYINCVDVVDIYVVTGSADCTIRKWDMTTCDCIFVYEGHTARIQKLLCKGNFLFSSSYDKTAKAWLFNTSDLEDEDEDKACLRTFKGHTKGVYPLIFIPSEGMLGQHDSAIINPGDLLISGSADHTARSWSFDTGGCLKLFKGHTGAITTMATDLTGKVLYTAGADATIKSWNVSTGQVMKTFRGHERMILDITFNKDRSYLFSASVDMFARSWLPEIGGDAKVFEGAQRSVALVYVKGNVLFTGCGDGITRAYDAKSAGLKRTYEGHTGAINCLIAVNDKLFTGSSDGTLKIWDVKDISDELNVDDEDEVAPEHAVPIVDPTEDESLDQKLDEMEAQDDSNEANEEVTENNNMEKVVEDTSSIADNAITASG